jgi:hypothetical protein
MMFSVERDLGDTIAFYIVPDNFSATPVARLMSEGRVLLEIEAESVIEALILAGRHSTGRCGFTVTAEHLAGLAGVEDLAIEDVETGILVYRRPNPRFVQKHVLHLSANLLPHRVFNNALGGLFQHQVTQVELHGHETVNQLFLLMCTTSSYLSGRLLYRNYEHYIEGKYETLVLVEDPYIAMAERLMVLSKIRNVQQPELILGRRDALVFEPAIEFAANLPLDDGKELRRAFRNASDDVLIAFIDPLTRMLTTASPGEMARENAVPQALDVLAGSAAVGVGGQTELFADTVAAHLGVNASEVPAPHMLRHADEIARLLREEAKVEQLIEKDLEVHAATVAAFRKAAMA